VCVLIVHNETLQTDSDYLSGEGQRSMSCQGAGVGRLCSSRLLPEPLSTAGASGLAQSPIIGSHADSVLACRFKDPFQVEPDETERWARAKCLTPFSRAPQIKVEDNWSLTALNRGEFTKKAEHRTTRGEMPARLARLVSYRQQFSTICSRTDRRAGHAIIVLPLSPRLGETRRPRSHHISRPDRKSRQPT
jgi:hypothetical protein